MYRRWSKRGAARVRGFTLVEVLIVIAIISLMAAVTLPYYLRETPGEAVTRAANDLAQVVRLSRYRAISLKRQVYVDLEAGGKDRFYTAYVNLGDPIDVPAGTPVFPRRYGRSLPDNLPCLN